MAQGLRSDDQAVTSPLGTAITIGIVVLLAGGLFLMVRVFTARDETPPPVTFHRDETQDSLQVLHSEANLLRSDFAVRMSVAGDFDAQAVGPGADALTANEFTKLGGAPDGPPDSALAEGTAFHFCATTGPATDVKVDIRHVPSNTVIWRGEFITLAQCPA